MKESVDVIMNIRFHFLLCPLITLICAYNEMGEQRKFIFLQQQVFSLNSHQQLITK